MIDDPHQIDTFEKIINNIKEALHKYIDNPNDEIASELIRVIGSIPYKYKEYDFWIDEISEVRDYMSMLFDLFDDYYQKFIKDGLKYDKIVKDSVSK